LDTVTTSGGSFSGTTLTLNSDISLLGSLLFISGAGITPTALTGTAAVTSNTASQSGTTLTFGSAITLANGQTFSVVGAGFAANTFITGDGTSKTVYTATVSQTVSVAVSVIVYQRTYTVSLTQPTVDVAIIYYSPSTYTVTGTTTAASTTVTVQLFAVNNNNLQYYFNWEQFLKKRGIRSLKQKYKLTFSFMTTSMTTSANHSFAYLQLPDLGIAEFQIGANINNNSYGGIIGHIYPNVIAATTSYISANSQQNPPVFLEYLPTQNVFTVQIRNILNDNLSNDFLAGLGDYILILSFEAIDEEPFIVTEHNF
jgi:hypothetical protein